MHALPSKNPLQPPAGPSWFPPLTFRTKPYLALCRSLDEALAELEARYPSHRRVLFDRRTLPMKRRRR